MSRVALVTAVALAATCGVTAAPQGSPDLRALYDAHRWFALRDAIAHGQAPLLYRGVVEAVFNDARERPTRKSSSVRRP
jgi:hypothetical protein